MSPEHREPRVLLSDVNQACAEIEYFIEGMDGDAYADDSRTRSAVERQFTIIGEALNQLHKICPELTERIPQLRQIIDFRNLLIHNYAGVISDLVWSYAENYLPQLRRIIQELLAELGSPEEQ